MSDLSSSNLETLSLSAIDRIDQILDHFALQLRRGQHPRIEDFLPLVEFSARGRLFRALVAIDYELAEGDPSAKLDDYLKRFPESQDVLHALQRQPSHLVRTSAEKKQHQTDLEYETDLEIGKADHETAISVLKPQLRHFKLLEIAGKGGFGTVWRARDLRLDREVAVKIPRSDKQGQVDVSAFQREAQVVAKLRHPNIVSVHEVSSENGISFIVTDFIDGVTLKEWRKQRVITPSDAARLVAKLAIPIQHAHDHGVIHRDLKLANILMDADGEPHVADFGLAKREARDDSMAIDGQVMGTLAYMAPEQARADHESTDRRTDIYSIGVILYELMTGTTPFRGDMSEMLYQIIEAPPLAPHLIKPGIPKDLEAICMKCLAKTNAGRYDSARALAGDLHSFLNGETLRGIPAALPNRVWKWLRRNRRSVMATSTVAVLVACVSAGLMAMSRSDPKPAIRLFPVEFKTKPVGCEITVVAIDPDSGEPDPTKIQNAKGTTPLTMPLAAGDYLVVAVLDSQRFHEVIRHVPDRDEGVAMGYTELRWKKSPSGTIEVSPIVIPRPDVSVGMGFCEGTDQLTEPKLRENSPLRSWRVPSFYVDLHELSIEELRQSLHRGPAELEKSSILRFAGEGPHALLNYWHAMSHLEALGKRTPSSAELYFLSKVLCPASEDRDGTCVLADQRLIEGLHSGLWEWTTTKPGGPFSRCNAMPKSTGLESLLRMAGAGAVDPEIEMTKLDLQAMKLYAPVAGARGVRSVRPRRTPQDFMTERVHGQD